MKGLEKGDEEASGSLPMFDGNFPSGLISGFIAWQDLHVGPPGRDN